MIVFRKYLDEMTSNKTVNACQNNCTHEVTQDYADEVKVLSELDPDF